MLGLNSQQMAVVAAPINSDLVVIAGAGTGKTRVIVSRIQRLLESGVNPQQIMAISFSRDTMKELKDRLQRDIGPAAGRIQVSTFNALGLKIISKYPREADLYASNKTFNEEMMCREIRKVFTDQYKVYPFLKAPDEEGTLELSLAAANANSSKDQFLADILLELCHTGPQYPVSQLAPNVPLPPVNYGLIAQDLGLIYPKSLSSTIDAQSRHYWNLSQIPEWQPCCNGLVNMHNYALAQVWHTLDSLSDFYLAQHWQHALWLNHGALEVLANCKKEIDMWNNNREFLGTWEGQFAFETEHVTFSMQELYSYVSKRKESGAMPRIHPDKVNYYQKSENFSTAWLRAYPCDLMRLQSIAPVALRRALVCPFKKEVDKTFFEAEQEKMAEELDSIKNGDYADETVGIVRTSNFSMHHLFSKGYKLRNGAPQENDPQYQDCSCTYCPYFLDWYELLFALYEQWREGWGVLDFPEQINRCVRLLQGFNGIRLNEQKNIRFLFVDEFQDTNKVQYDLLCLLKTAREVPEMLQNHLCVVGDDDQSIYGWRGANFECLRMIHDYLGNEGSEFKSLTINYRSHQNILNLANSLIQHNRSRLVDKRLVCPSAFDFEQTVKTMVGYDSSSPRVNVVGIDSYRLEGVAIAQAISFMHKKRGIPYKDMAVLFRINQLSASVEFALLQQNIPYVIKEHAFATRAPVKNALAALRLALDPHDDEAFILVAICLFRKRGEKMIHALQEIQFKGVDIEKLQSKSGFARKKQDSANTKYSNGNALPAFATGANRQGGAAASGYSNAKHAFNSSAKGKDGKGKDKGSYLKVEDLFDLVRLDINHYYVPSLYQVVHDLADRPLKFKMDEKEKELVSLFMPLCENIDNVQEWNSTDTLSGNMFTILRNMGIEQHYNNIKAGDDEDSHESSDDWSNILQLVSIADMLIHTNDEVQEQSPDQSNPAQSSQAQSSSAPSCSVPTSASDSAAANHTPAKTPAEANNELFGTAHYEFTEVGFVDLASDSHSPNPQKAAALHQEHSSSSVPHRTKMSSKERLHNLSNIDPWVKQDQKQYSDEEVELRHYARNMIFQLDNNCSAAWAEPLRSLKETINQDDQNQDKVNLLSIHGSKGKEFSVVFVIGFEKDILPYYSAWQNDAQFEEERRLAYVAITRAKRYLFLTFCRNRLSKKDIVKDTGRSSFVFEALQEWKSKEQAERPYVEILIKQEDFELPHNIWEGRVEL